jgi:hypothetical protein
MEMSSSSEEYLIGTRFLKGNFGFNFAGHNQRQFFFFYLTDSSKLIACCFLRRMASESCFKLSAPTPEANNSSS